MVTKNMEENKKETEKLKKCCICKKEIIGYGNNPAPVKEYGVCCDDCNLRLVIPRRLIEWQ